LSKEIEMNRHS